MTLASQQYANLVEHSYDRDGQMRDLVNKEIELEGVRYKILHFVDNTRTGYQGTVYQHLGSGDIVVAHRGTEFERQRWDDLIKTDGTMVLTRANLQADDAVALTGWALDYAEKQGQLPGKRTPEVTVTGHSLGGTLAQVSAHYYDLRGETFNAYGAVSLDRRIPEGGDRVVNHVMAADTVSSASPHYGKVRIYAQPDEVGMLVGAGYANNSARLLDPRASLVAGIRGFGSHDMHRFLNVDGEQRPDRSVLGDVRTQALAREYAPMIVKYRDDVEGMRSAITITARGPHGVLRDGFDALRGRSRQASPVRVTSERARRRSCLHGVPSLPLRARAMAAMERGWTAWSLPDRSTRHSSPRCAVPQLRWIACSPARGPTTRMVCASPCRTCRNCGPRRTDRPGSANSRSIDSDLPNLRHVWSRIKGC